MPRSANYWDSLTLANLARGRSVNMFGNYNIGDISLTNLRVSGMLVHGEEACILTHWYARTDFDPEHKYNGYHAYANEFRKWSEGPSWSFASTTASSGARLLANCFEVSINPT